MAILIFGKRVIHYKKIRSYFYNINKECNNNKNNKNNFVLTQSENALLIHWRTTFYVMEATYNYVLKRKYYDVDIWT